MSNTQLRQRIDLPHSAWLCGAGGTDAHRSRRGTALQTGEGERTTDFIVRRIFTTSSPKRCMRVSSKRKGMTTRMGSGGMSLRIIQSSSKYPSA